MVSFSAIIHPAPRRYGQSVWPTTASLSFKAAIRSGSRWNWFSSSPLPFSPQVSRSTCFQLFRSAAKLRLKPWAEIDFQQRVFGYFPRFPRCLCKDALTYNGRLGYKYRTASLISITLDMNNPLIGLIERHMKQ